MTKLAKRMGVEAHAAVRREPPPEPPRWPAHSQHRTKVWSVMYRNWYSPTRGDSKWSRHATEEGARVVCLKQERTWCGISKGRSRGYFYILGPDGMAYCPV